MDDSDIFGWHLWLGVYHCGLCQAEEVVFLGDAAAWIRHERCENFGLAMFIIDWYHASEHVWDCGKALFGEGSQATEKWVKKRESWLWDGQTRKLLNDLRREQKQRRGAKRKELAGLRKHIRDNEQEMRYNVFRTKGDEMGSGAVEGACKHVLGKRLNKSGMIWSGTGSSAILALRVACLNEKWEQL